MLCSGLWTSRRVLDRHCPPHRPLGVASRNSAYEFSDGGIHLGRSGKRVQPFGRGNRISQRPTSGKLFHRIGTLLRILQALNPIRGSGGVLGHPLHEQVVRDALGSLVVFHSAYPVGCAGKILPSKAGSNLSKDCFPHSAVFGREVFSPFDRLHGAKLGIFLGKKSRCLPTGAPPRAVL